jgi:hypothetical protein
VEVEVAETTVGELVKEEAKEGGLTGAGLTDDKGEIALVLEEIQAGQSSVETLVVQEPGNGRVFGKGMVGHFEVR